MQLLVNHSKAIINAIHVPGGYSWMELTCKLQSTAINWYTIRHILTDILRRWTLKNRTEMMYEESSNGSIKYSGFMCMSHI